MRKLFTLLVIILFHSTFLFAQETQTLTATVTRTKHNTAVTEDLVTKGKFYFSNPDKICMTFDEEKEKLLMDGNNFILINDGKSSVAKGKEANHLELLQSVLQSILTGGDGIIDIHKAENMEITRQDNIIRIAPSTDNAKVKRRMMFTSFTLTLDPGTFQLKSLCMYEKGENYTRYDLSGYKLNEIVNENLFNSEI